MSMAASKTRLAAVTKELFLKWQQTRDCWKDAKALEFESQYLTELLAAVDKAVAVIDQLDKLSAKVRSDCE